MSSGPSHVLWTCSTPFQALVLCLIPMKLAGKYPQSSVYTWIAERATSASEDSFQSAPCPSQREPLNLLSQATQDTEIPGVTSAGIEYTVRTWTTVHKKGTFWIWACKFQDSFYGRLTGTVLTGHMRNSQQPTGSRPCAQPSLLKLTEKPHPATLYYIQYSQRCHTWQGHTCSKWRLKCKFTHTY